MMTPTPKKLAAVTGLAAIMMMAAAMAPLDVGSSAPPVPKGKWIKGEAVEKFEPGKVYLVEFWATWCGPCIRAIPHLTSLQQKNRDQLVVIGVAGAERKPKTEADNRLDKVRKFVTDQGSKMAYRVVFDPTDDSWNTWMAAAGKTGIPCTFIVDHTGKIAWIGHPQRVDKPLADALKAAPRAKRGRPDERGAGNDDSDGKPGDGNKSAGAGDGSNDGSRGGGTDGGTGGRSNSNSSSHGSGSSSGSKSGNSGSSGGSHSGGSSGGGSSGGSRGGTSGGKGGSGTG